MKAGSLANNSYLLNVDGNTCFNVGGAGVSAAEWVWVDYQDGSQNTKINMTLAKGSHSLTLVGTMPDVNIDHIIALSDTTCIPTGNGDNCNVASDTTPPTVAITAPQENATVSGTVSIAATASDASDIGKVEYYLNSTLLGTQTTGSYAYAWNTATTANGPQTIIVKAYDKSGNFASDTIHVTVQNGDTTAPSQPTGLKATPANGKVALSWAASTDSIGVTRYEISRNGVPLAAYVTTTGYEDVTVTPNTSYTYTVSALDAAGNRSLASAPASVTTPAATDAIAPSVPNGLSAAAASSSQINLSWNVATDDTAVVAYDVYRAPKGSTLRKIATVTSTSFGDTNLKANTTYQYAVRAKDAAGNTSAQSATAQATTPRATTRGVVQGVVKDAKGKPIANARVVVDGPSGRARYQSNSKGAYTIKGLTAGRYTVTYKARQFASQSFTMHVDSTVITKDVTLQRR